MSKNLRTFAKIFKDMNKDKKVILFVRCSTEQQDISSQIADLKTFAKSLGFTNESEYYIIGGIAASAVKLNELYLSYISELKQMISDNKCKCVLVFALNRLFRNELVGAELKDFFINTKTHLYISFSYLFENQISLIFLLYLSYSKNHYFYRKFTIFKDFLRKKKLPKNR